MKIISKYKDYYDYMSGIYGVDEKVVLDRRDGFAVDGYRDCIYRLRICGMVYDGMYTNNKWYWCGDLREVCSKVEYWGFSHTTIEGVRECDTVAFGGIRHIVLSVVPYKDTKNLNRKENCPILLDNGSKYPKLEPLGFASILPPKDIYLMLTEWLSYTPDVVDTRDDKLKILSNGFDLKTSFRNM